MAEFKPFEMIMLMEYGGAVSDGDAVQVCVKAKPIAKLVRCKDCKHWNEFIMNRKPQGYGLCTLHEITHKTDTDWFCADGERRDPCSSQDS